MIKLQKDIFNTFSICNQGETARKNKEVFNTVFEMELRIMLLMSSVPELFFRVLVYWHLTSSIVMQRFLV